MQSIFLNDVVVFNWTVAECVFYFYNSAALLIFILCSVISYLHLRPKLPSRVNCWFCNRSFWVPYPSRNCFDCRYCDQYNGFTDEGDYNTDILLRKRTNGVEPKMTQADPVNGLCKSCNVNQQLKVQQLANFVPMIEENYDQEVQHFQNQLDKCYKLCERCALILTQTLQTQHYNMLEKRLNGHCPVGTPRSPKTALTRYQIRKTCYVGSTSCLVLLLSLTAYELAKALESVGEFFTIEVESFLWLGVKEISSIGAVLSLIETVLHEKFATKNCLYFSSWGVLLCISWMENRMIFAVSTFITLLIHLWPKKVEMKKLRVEKMQPVPMESISQAVKVSVNAGKETVTEKVPKKIETPKIVKNTPHRMETRSQAKKISPQENTRSRLFSPTREVYDGFSNLRLSSVEPEPRPQSSDKNIFTQPLSSDQNIFKQPLSSDQNIFKQPQTPNQNIIKPSKFTLGAKPTTPPLINCFTPSEPLPDLNICKYSPYHMDYDYNPCSPGYFAPVTHTSYSYSFRPAQMPYGFPSGRYSPPFTSPYDSTNSSNISDSLHNNHFYTGKNNQIWDWMKRCLCVSCVFLNIIAMVFFFDELRRRMF